VLTCEEARGMMNVILAFLGNDRSDWIVMMGLLAVAATSTGYIAGRHRYIQWKNRRGSN
jgi:hypothetical protein